MSELHFSTSKGCLALLMMLCITLSALVHVSHGQEDQLEALAVPQECEATGGDTTSACSPSCAVCANTGINPRRRECLCCKPGWVNNPTRSAQCTPCPVGSFAPQPGMTPCRRCTRGLTTRRRGSSVCDACPPGRELKVTTTTTKAGKTITVRTCQVCRKGFISPGGVIRGDPQTSPACEPCPAGKTTIGNRKTTCDGCAPGYGGTACTMCAAGTYSLGGNNNDKTPDCLPCPAGSTSDAGARRCTRGGTSPSPPTQQSPSPPVSPTPSPGTSPGASPGPSPATSPAPSSPTPDPPTGPGLRTCFGFTCANGVLKRNPGSIELDNGDGNVICCDTCRGMCPSGNNRANYVLPARLAPSYELCCDECARVPNICTSGNTQRSPSPQLALNTATEQLCCNVPPVSRPVVQMAVEAVTCNDQANEALAAATLQALVTTNGLTPAEQATVDVKVVSCEVLSDKRRHLLADRTVVILGITIRPDIPPEQVANATKVLIDVLGVADTAGLAENATLEELVQVLNDGLNATQSQDGQAAVGDLLATVNAAIANANLGNVFVNATAVESVVAAPASCPGLPSAGGVLWPVDACADASINFNCVGRCNSGSGQVTSRCLSTGFWSTPNATKLNVCNAPPPAVTLSCTTNPIAVTNAVWSGCANQQQCTASCVNNTRGSPGAPTAFCNTGTGQWTTPVGACVPITCDGVPSSTITNGYWPNTCTNNTVGGACPGICIGTGSAPEARCNRNGNTTTASWTLIGAPGSCTDTFRTNATCNNKDADTMTPGPVYVCGDGFELKPNPGSINIAGLNDTSAKTLCCDQIYAAGATCTAFVCGAGFRAKPNSGGNSIAGEIVNGAVARTACCDELFPVNATCADRNGNLTGVTEVQCQAGFKLKRNPATISIFNMTAGEAATACCNPVYPSGTLCNNANAGQPYECGTYHIIEASNSTKSVFNLSGEEAFEACCSLVKSITVTVNNILPFRPIVPGTSQNGIEDKLWYGTDLRNDTCNGTCISFPDLGIDRLQDVTASHLFQGRTLNVTTNIVQNRPDDPSLTGTQPIDSALRLVTVFGGNSSATPSQGSDRVHAVISFPNRRLGERPGLFNGVTWSQFIRGGGYFQFDWYKATWGHPNCDGGGAISPALHIRLSDPALYNAGVVTWNYNEFVYEAVYNIRSSRVPGCVENHQWAREFLNFTVGDVWVTGALRRPYTDGKYIPIRTWMDNPAGSISDLSGWPGKISDTLTATWPGGYNYTGFFDRAVITDIRISQAFAYSYTWANNLKVVYGDYDWTWVFKAP